MYLFKDLASERIRNYFSTEKNSLIREVLAQFDLPQIYPPWDAFNDNSASVVRRLENILLAAESICAKYDFATFLFHYRRMPHEVAFEVLQQIKKTPNLDLDDFAPVYSESLLFGTNCILKFSRRPSVASMYIDLHKLIPSDAEVRDVCKLIVLSILHRHNLFFLNSLARRDITSLVSYEELLGVYNRRLKKRWQLQIAWGTKNVIIYPAFSVTIPIEKRLWKCTDARGNEHSIILNNFFPVPSYSESDIARYQYLDNEDFTKQVGVPFSEWCKVWRGLNKIVTQNLAILWQNGWFAASSIENLQAGLERSDDYCLSALGGGSLESIWKTCHLLLEEELGTNAPSPNICKSVIDSLTFKTFDGDVRFPEQPYVFYPINPQTVFWDYYRHSALLRSLARNLVGKPNTPQMAKAKGKFLEAHVADFVSDQLPNVSALKLDKRIKDRDGNLKWQIDVGFVYEGILFLVEAKNWVKKVKYYFDAGVEVSSRVSLFESVLDEQDENLRNYNSIVRDMWGEIPNIEGAICVVCTEEAEFVASFDRKLWLDIEIECPRICLLTELLECLKLGKVKALKQHPSFVTFEYS